MFVRNTCKNWLCDVLWWGQPHSRELRENRARNAMRENCIDRFQSKKSEQKRAMNQNLFRKMSTFCNLIRFLFELYGWVKTNTWNWLAPNLKLERDSRKSIPNIIINRIDNDRYHLCAVKRMNECKNILKQPFDRQPINGIKTKKWKYVKKNIVHAADKIISMKQMVAFLSQTLRMKEHDQYKNGIRETKHSIHFLLDNCPPSFETGLR